MLLPKSCCTLSVIIYKKFCIELYMLSLFLSKVLSISMLSIFDRFLAVSHDSIRGCVRSSVGPLLRPSVTPSVGPSMTSFFCRKKQRWRVSGLVDNQIPLSPPKLGLWPPIFCSSTLKRPGSKAATQISKGSFNNNIHASVRHVNGKGGRDGGRWKAATQIS